MSKEIKCGGCGYQYTPRKKNPKSCPMCKGYYEKVGVEKVGDE